ncbi:MAG: CapA family protein, partial [Erysipelotrichaceae bacterium]|nr:CapA family protein [Erysipelotrichaceae bacterium]
MAVKVKRKLKFGNIFITISLTVLCGLVFVYLTGIFNEQKFLEDGNEATEKIEEPKEENYEVSMVMVGDNLIHSSIYKDAMTSDGNYDFTKMYELIKPIVSEYDIAYYNQETILGGKELGVNDYPTFNSPQEVGDAMIDAGFNLVSLASNHTMDSGERAVLASRQYWDSKEDVLA